jgi:hypothetical protein
LEAAAQNWREFDNRTDDYSSGATLFIWLDGSYPGDTAVIAAWESGYRIETVQEVGGASG